MVAVRGQEDAVVGVLGPCAGEAMAKHQAGERAAGGHDTAGAGVENRCAERLQGEVELIDRKRPRQARVGWNTLGVPWCGGEGGNKEDDNQRADDLFRKFPNKFGSPGRATETPRLVEEFHPLGCRPPGPAAVLIS